MNERWTKLALGSVTLAALALAGVPELLPAGPPPGALRGVVVDSSGYALRDARVFLFAGDSGHPRAETRTDTDGAFDFGFVPPHPRVFVRAPAGSGRLDAFGPAHARGTLAFVLHPARALAVRVVRPGGLALEGLEVRVHSARGDGSAIALAHTDATGCVELPAPARAHVVVEERASGLFRWAFEVEVPAAGRTLELELGASTPLTGRLQLADVPGTELVVELHTLEPEPRWCGRTHSAADGTFTLPRPPGACILSVHDPRGRIPSTRVELAAGEGPGVIGLAAGTPQVVRTARAGRPLATRVHLFDPQTGLLGPGFATDGAGRLALGVPPHFTLIATPLDGEGEPIHEWELTPGARELVLDAPREP